MTQSSKLFDELGKLMNNAAGVADGVRREIETAVKSQLERLIADMDLVKREDFDALRELVQTQSAELKALKAEVDAPEGQGLSAGADRGHFRRPRQPARPRCRAGRYCPGRASMRRWRWAISSAGRATHWAWPIDSIELGMPSVRGNHDRYDHRRARERLAHRRRWCAAC